MAERQKEKFGGSSKKDRQSLHNVTKYQSYRNEHRREKNKRRLQERLERKFQRRRDKREAQIT